MRRRGESLHLALFTVTLPASSSGWRGDAEQGRRFDITEDQFRDLLVPRAIPVHRASMSLFLLRTGADPRLSGWLAGSGNNLVRLEPIGE